MSGSKRHGLPPKPKILATPLALHRSTKCCRFVVEEQHSSQRLNRMKSRMTVSSVDDGLLTKRDRRHVDVQVLFISDDASGDYIRQQRRGLKSLCRDTRSCYSPTGSCRFPTEALWVHTQIVHECLQNTGVSDPNLVFKEEISCDKKKIFRQAKISEEGQLPPAKISTLPPNNWQNTALSLSPSCNVVMTVYV